MKVWVTTKVKLDPDKNELSRFRFKEMTIDSSGNVLDETEYNEDGTVSCKRIYRYFENGSVNEYVEYDPLDELIERHTYLCNDAGDVEQVLYEYADGRKVIRKYHFSELGLADTATLYDENNSILGYETCVFNEEGEVIERIEFDEENVEILKYINTFDDSGNAKEERKFAEGKLTEVTLYTYGSIGNVTTKEVSNKVDGYLGIDEYEYDEWGNVVRNVSFQNGTLVFENKCTYDQDHNLLTEEFFEIDFWEKRVTRHEKLLHFSKS